MSRSVEDIVLVSRCVAFDDRKAFACLVNKYQGRIKRFFLHLTGGDWALSDDLAQETFIKVYLHLRDYRRLSSFSTWLYRVAYNQFYDELRRSGRMRDDAIDEADGSAVTPTTDVDRRLDLTRALSILRPEERTAITLFFYDDLAVAKIAEVMNIPEGTVKSHLSRGKCKLEKFLKENGYERVE